MNRKHESLKKHNHQTFTYWEDTCDIKEVAARRTFKIGKEIHVWHAPLFFYSQYCEKLSPEEIRRSIKLRVPRDKQRYITSHYLLRQILAAYFDCDSAAIDFGRNEYGKPFLIPQNRKNHIQFNMSHSEDIVCIIISKRADVGIDIEFVKDDLEWLSIAKKCFTSEEISFLLSSPKKDRLKNFLILWTRKEAILKAIGLGLSGFDQISRFEANFSKEDSTLVHFDCGDKYQGALAVTSKIPLVHYFRLTSWDTQ